MKNYLILYPRTYNQRGVEQLHSVMGLTPEGEEVNVKLRLDPAHIGKKYAPSISEFARDDRKATTPCINSPDNSPDGREGVLLFTQVASEPRRSGKPAFVAKWAAVLCEDKDSPEPLIGIGRVKIDLSPEGYKLKSQIAKAHKAGIDTEKMERALEDESMYEFPVIMYHHTNTQSRPITQTKYIKDAIAFMIRTNSVKGVVGGVMIRVQDPMSQYERPYYREVFPRFVLLNRKYEDADTVASSVVSALPAEFSDQARIDLIPLTRIDCGPRGSQYYGKPSRSAFLRRCFEDSDGEPLVCHVAVRVTEFTDNNTTLLSRIYPLSRPLGHPLQLGINGIQYAYPAKNEPSSSALDFSAVCSAVTLSQVSSMWNDDIHMTHNHNQLTSQITPPNDTEQQSVHDNENECELVSSVVDENTQGEEHGDGCEVQVLPEAKPAEESVNDKPLSPPQSTELPSHTDEQEPAQSTHVKTGVLAFLIKKGKDL